MSPAVETEGLEDGRVDGPVVALAGDDENLDFRALWSVSARPPSFYTYEFWAEYTAFCRQVAGDAGVSMRQLDRTLWQYSKEKQPRA